MQFLSAEYLGGKWRESWTPGSSFTLHAVDRTAPRYGGQVSQNYIPHCRKILYSQPQSQELFMQAACQYVEITSWGPESPII